METVAESLGVRTDIVRPVAATDPLAAGKTSVRIEVEQVAAEVLPAHAHHLVVGVKVIGIRPDIREARRGLSVCAEPVFGRIFCLPAVFQD